MLDDGPYSAGPSSCLLYEYLRKLGALEAYEASPMIASHTLYLTRGEGAGESTVALGFICCEEHERFILGFLCSLCEHFFTAALSHSFFPVFQGRAPSRRALRGSNSLKTALPGLAMRCQRVRNQAERSPSILQIL